MDKYLILNADDFGYDAETNEAIETLLKSERITSVSLLAPAPAAEDAADRAKRLGVSVGVHLCLTADDAAAGWKSVSGAKSLGGSLPHDVRSLTFGATRRDVRAELAAQYDRIAALGCGIDHADAHSGALRETGGRAAPAIKAIHGAILRQAEKRNVLLPDDVFSDPRKAEAIESRDALFAYYLNAVRGCGAGVTEIFLHPRVSEAGPGSPWRKRRWEYDLLLSGALIREAKACGVQVVGPAQCYR